MVHDDAVLPNVKLIFWRSEVPDVLFGARNGGDNLHVGPLQLNSVVCEHFEDDIRRR